MKMAIDDVVGVVQVSQQLMFQLISVEDVYNLYGKSELNFPYSPTCHVALRIVLLGCAINSTQKWASSTYFDSTIASIEHSTNFLTLCPRHKCILDTFRS